jgi:hypothetical protein
LPGDAAGSVLFCGCPSVRWTGADLYGGNFYGPYGFIGAGGVFRLSRQGSNWTINPLKQITIPVSRLVIGPDGALYGTSIYGGSQGHCYGGGPCGTVFKLQPPLRSCPTVSCPWIETVLYEFTGGSDGGNPNSEVTFDSAGNLYGVTQHGGSTNCTLGCGVVYKLTRSGNIWTESVVDTFLGGSDGNYPSGGLVFDAAGNLYGVTSQGGTNIGTLYQLTPVNGAWRQTILRNFQPGNGNDPIGTLAIDSAGNLYGVTETGGPANFGVVYEMTQSPPFIWNYLVLYTFPTPANASGGLTIDSQGEVVGTTAEGGSHGMGYLYKLAISGGLWTFTDLHDFDTPDGYYANGNVVIDASGNMFGSAEGGGGSFNFCDFGCGTVWEFQP